MNYETIQFDVDDGVARLTLSRADKLNSFNGRMHAEVRSVLSRVEEATSIRVLVITGAGRAFCAGQDLSDPEVAFRPGEQAPDLGAVVERHYKPLVMALNSLRVPTIAAVNGTAAGAGASIALTCDLVVAKRSASFIQAFSKIALVPDTGGTWRLPQRIGMARAMGLAMLGEKLSAEQAAQWGLIWHVEDDERFDDVVTSLAQRIAAMPTRALVRTRQAMHAAFNNTLEQQLDLEAGFMRELGWCADYAEGVTAFGEKRSPRFRGA